ncbi:hypothetical protein [Ruminiclostridium cellobioparum]|uniref:Uncharacterized protein n=1 Tax=Ruminiclostridium cellobioparum subsp. termitidis CT1112 TaxID=1195236 RepID=S0FPG9_RUMCE|nr:hypothetical protein [Ruminiclostridium cellobioparum]EMS70333.1 hypothetical protein CTER_3931 [Ruminiclostridium cellobioparum subsp. termitidis CT1112]
MKIKDFVLKIVNKPVDNITSSQTLYEALLAILNMDIKFDDIKYKIQAKKVADLIMKSQLKDGGFDIGYNFLFGKQMSKKSHKESTTPEILSVYALIKYYDLYKDDKVVQSIKHGINWIRNFSYKYKDCYWVIPYAPCSYKEVHITNGISFTVGTLVYYMHVFNDYGLKDICDGMLTYMKDQLIIYRESGYWNYFEKELMTDPFYIKIDNYHIAQQLYYHLEIDKYYSNEDNKEIIRLVSVYLKRKLTDDIAVPYIEVNGKISRDIHTWGYCSLLLCALLWEDSLHIERIKAFMASKFIVSDHFAPIIKPSGEIVDKNYYPRSDAWVLHSLSEYLLYVSDEQVRKIIDTGLDKLGSCYYKGYENHVLTKRKKMFNFLVRILKNAIRR